METIIDAPIGRAFARLLQVSEKETCNKTVFAMEVKMILLVIRHGESEADILDVHVAGLILN